MPNNFTNITDFGGMLELANSNSGGFFWTGVTWMVFLILFLSTMAFGWEVGILAAAFFGMVVAMLFAYLGLVSWTIVSIFVGILLVMFLYIVWSSGRE
jgi:hypothetical protein